MEQKYLSDDVIEQIKAIEQTKDFHRQELTEEQELLIDKLILNEELKNRYKIMVCAKSASSLILVRAGFMGGVSHVMVNGLNIISKIGLVEIMTSMSLFKEHN